MTLTTTTTANEIINRAAAEVGIPPIPDPYSSADTNFIQLKYLLITAGEELVMAYGWEGLIREHSLITSSSDSGNYDLPADFAYMIDQTGWEANESVPLGGPLSAQDWTYLKGRNLITESIYASFRIKEGKFALFPQPPVDGLDISFEYISKDWVLDSSNPGQFRDAPSVGSDVPQFDKTLISRYLKLKFLESKGFDTTKAQDDFNQAFNFITGKDTGGEILSAGRSSRGTVLLDTWRNVPSTNYGIT